MASLKLYYDLLSQPARAVVIFLEINNIPYEGKLIDIRAGENQKESFIAINPFKRVPVIEEKDGFILRESAAILKYLSAKYKVPDHWYPSDIRKRARVDEYMAWHHNNTRPKAAAVYLATVVEPRRTQSPANPMKLSSLQDSLDTMLDSLEMLYLRDNSYLCGDDLTLADLLALCEIYQLQAANHDIAFPDRPRLSGWVARTSDRLQPHLNKANKVVLQIRENFLVEEAERKRKFKD